jgi:hypothetical protein
VTYGERQVHQLRLQRVRADAVSQEPQAGLAGDPNVREPSGCTGRDEAGDAERKLPEPEGQAVAGENTERTRRELGPQGQ